MTKLVFGHKSPDTDTICSALVYEDFKVKQGEKVEARRLGEVNKETQYALDYFGVKAPAFLERVEDGTEVILVDHNEFQQSVDNIESATIVEVVDHHRISNFETKEPLYFRAEPVGCTATIIHKMYKENIGGIHMSRKQFNLARTALLDFMESFDEETADIQAKPFNNTLRWHVGHVLTLTEKLLFQYPKKSDHIPENYATLFSPGTKPSDWTEEPPSLDKLKEQLLNQQERLNNFDDLFWKTNVTFKVPFGSIETFGDLLIMLGHHETEHLGKMKAMLQVLEAEK